jgi:hypothetical protein
MTEIKGNLIYSQIPQKHRIRTLVLYIQGLVLWTAKCSTWIRFYETLLYVYISRNGLYARSTVNPRKFVTAPHILNGSRLVSTELMLGSAHDYASSRHVSGAIWLWSQACLVPFDDRFGLSCPQSTCPPQMTMHGGLTNSRIENSLSWPTFQVSICSGRFFPRSGRNPTQTSGGLTTKILFLQCTAQKGETKSPGMSHQ